ncbi:hypothetical protein Tco_0711834 [Tanacetum coccineum]
MSSRVQLDCVTGSVTHREICVLKEGSRERGVKRQLVYDDVKGGVYIIWDDGGGGLVMWGERRGGVGDMILVWDSYGSEVNGNEGEQALELVKGRYHTGDGESQQRLDIIKMDNRGEGVVRMGMKGCGYDVRGVIGGDGEVGDGVEFGVV